MPQSLTPELRSQRARIAAFTKWSKTDGKAGTQAARDAYFQRFLTEVDPDQSLSQAERLRRAKAAYRAHMTRLAFKSAKARRRKSA